MMATPAAPQDNAPQTGVPYRLEDGVQMVLAPNAAAMTHRGTNTYLVGETVLAVIDPGPDDPAHLAALDRAIAGRPVSHILITHSHRDHSGLARKMAQRVKAPVCAFGPSDAGLSPVMRGLVAAGMPLAGWGVDTDFAPDLRLADGAAVTGPDWVLDAVHTPGHMGNHLCFRLRDALFTGDHVMGWASSVVAPPVGDLGDFMRATRRLLTLPARIFYPGHGAPVTAPHDRLRWLLDHRMARENQIRAVLACGPATVDAVTRRIYTDLPAGLADAAQRNVFAYLIELSREKIVTATPSLTQDAVYRLIPARDVAM